jgi:hypothetical protein
MIREFKFFHGITIQTEGIRNIIRTLRAQWSPELVDDLINVHAIDAEAELTRILSEEITREMDENVISIINGGQRA